MQHFIWVKLTYYTSKKFKTKIVVLGRNLFYIIGSSTKRGKDQKIILCLFFFAFEWLMKPKGCLRQQNLRWTDWRPSHNHTLGVNFINVFTQSFYAQRSQKPKKLLELTDFFALLGSVGVKTASEHVVEIDPYHRSAKEGAWMWADFFINMDNSIWIRIKSLIRITGRFRIDLLLFSRTQRLGSFSYKKLLVLSKTGPILKQFHDPGYFVISFLRKKL